MDQSLSQLAQTGNLPSNGKKVASTPLTAGQQKALKVLQEVIQIKSDNDHEKQVALYYQKLLEEHGIASEVVDYQADRANLVAEIKNGAGKILAISGHMDVVSAGDENDWTHPPYAGHIDESGVMWGRGTSDMKAGLSALIFALIDLNESKNFKGTIRLLATLGEEIGEYGSKQLTELGYIDDVDGLLIAEPCNVGIMYAHKGSLNYKLVSRGAAAHSSAPEQGSNAIEHLNIAMTEISKRLKEKSAEFKNETLGQTFHNITLIKGGVQINSIPDYAEFEANARTIPEFDNQAVVKEVEAVINELNKQEGFKLELQVTADQPPVQSEADSALIRAILDAARERESLQVPALFASMGQVMGKDLSAFAKSSNLDTLKPMVSSGTTDAAQFTRNRKDIELAVYGPGMPLLNHKIDERIPLQQYFDFIEVYSDIMARYLN